MLVTFRLSSSPDESRRIECRVLFSEKVDPLHVQVPAGGYQLGAEYTLHGQEPGAAHRVAVALHLAWG